MTFDACKPTQSHKTKNKYKHIRHSTCVLHTEQILYFGSFSMPQSSHYIKNKYIATNKEKTN